MKKNHLFKLLPALLLVTTLARGMTLVFGLLSNKRKPQARKFKVPFDYFTRRDSNDDYFAERCIR